MSAFGRTKPKEENHWPLIYQTLLLYQRVHLQDQLADLLELRRSPIGRRRTPPIRTTARSRSPSASPRRGRALVGRRGRSSSYSGSPSPRKLPRRSRSCSLRRPIKGKSCSNSSRSSSPLLPRNV
ncbi:serine/arginine-rich splicing factor SR45-like isoform X2 [Quercus robur]|uniref:serine/arginine-rich splicing factor SR45-like isoform X2 n=1 Tax=Quercus robur TaxID=38942 RepID=UPI0021617774|nr:serine/arginine-rich splicing factor SR45-like isoform X2 [Quercus robur]